MVSLAFVFCSLWNYFEQCIEKRGLDLTVTEIPNFPQN